MPYLNALHLDQTDYVSAKLQRGMVLIMGRKGQSMSGQLPCNQIHLQERVYTYTRIPILPDVEQILEVNQRDIGGACQQSAVMSLPHQER